MVSFYRPFSSRSSWRSAAEWPAELVSEVQDYNDIRIMGAIEDRIMLSTSNLPQMDAVLIMTFVLPNTSETSSAALSAVAYGFPVFSDHSAGMENRALSLGRDFIDEIVMEAP